MTTEKEKIKEKYKKKWTINKDISCWWEKIVDESYKAGKAKVIELGNELIEEYFDKPSSVFWDKLKGELTTK